MTALARREGLVQASLAPRTRNAYGKELERFDTWRGDLDVCDETVADYIAMLFDAGLAPQSASLALAAIKFRWRLERGSAPHWPLTRHTMGGFGRRAAHRGRGQARGIQWRDASKIAHTASADGLTGLRDAALIAVMSDAMLRVSEAVAIDVEHIRHTDGGSVLWVPRSKTDQTGLGATLYLGPPTVDAVNEWREAAGVHTGPLFRAVWKDTVGERRITTKTVTRIVKRRAGECGMSAGISGHSLRVGSAQSLATAGASLVEMQQEGRWASTRMPARYAAGELATRRATARLRYGT